MIDESKIPESSLMDICSVLYDAVREYFKDPENKKAYEAWAKERGVEIDGREQGIPNG